MKRILAVAACALVACGPSGEAGAGGDPAAAAPLDARALLDVLASDSLEGRRTGSRGAEKAAALLVAQFAAVGLEPVGDDGFVQRVPLVVVPGAEGRDRLRLAEDAAAWDTLPAPSRRASANVVGRLPGYDPALRDESVLVIAHYDHVGIRRPVDGDSIYNGADDDASGTVALVEIARRLAASPPRRSVVFAALTGEEMGMLGARWYADHPPVPLERTVAVLGLEMVGRPDTAIAAGSAWLTGFERSALGPTLAAAGLPVVPDPRPGQRFHERSDHVAFARKGVPAHTLSTFGLHADYHTPGDEVETIDFDHLARVIEVATGAVRVLADGVMTP